MNKLEETIEKLYKLENLIEEINKTYDVNLKYKLQRYVQGLAKYAKFKVGDRVKLSKTPVINEKESCGWLGYKAMLIKGAIGTVKEVDFYNKFCYLVCIDNPFWVDSEGKVRSFEHGEPSFNFSEDFLEFENENNG